MDARRNAQMGVKMRILLDAYFDNNFGDDLFVDILLKRYPDALFYAFWRKTPENVMSRAAKFRNLVILPGGCAMQESWPFDAYVMIGGDVLPDGVDYTERIARMKHVKECGGFVAMLGFSLYKEYGEKTIQDLKSMAELADAIVIRDHFSAERFKTLVPGAKVTEATDMVFTARDIMKEVKVRRKSADGSDVQKEAVDGANSGEQIVSAVPANRVEQKARILGIIPRRKLYSTDEEHLAYCQGMAAIADDYLQKYPQGRVRFLAYSTGEYDDRVTARDIIAQMECVQNAGGVGEEPVAGGEEGKTAATVEETRVEIIGYEGELEEFLTAIGACDALLPTRFHGLVFSLMNRQPFVPVPYEVKLTQLLDELGYGGVRIPYGEELTTEQVEQAVEGLEQFAVSQERLTAYEQKAAGFFEAMDAWSRGCPANCAEANGKTGMVDEAERNERNAASGSTENMLESTRKEELSGRYSGVLCAAGEDREALQAENQMLTKQVEELNKWIAALQQQKAAFEEKSQELEELRRQQAEQLLDMEMQYKTQKQITEQRELELENQKNMAKQQNDELMKWIESLKKERAVFERQNMELEGIRQWQWDQLMRVPLMSRKIESEYNSFLQSLREKLDKQLGL